MRPGHAGVAVVTVALTLGCGRFGFESLTDDAGADAAVSEVLSVDTLLPQWVLGQSARLRWTSQGQPEQFASARIVLGFSEEDVASESPESFILDSDSHPELGHWFLPDTNIEVQSTTVSKLADQSTYYYQVHLQDLDGAVAKSDIGSFRTANDPGGVIELFLDSPGMGTSIPDGLEVVDTAPHSGVSHYQLAIECPTTTKSCFQAIGREAIKVASTPIASTGEIDGSFYELHVAIDGTEPSYRTELKLRFGDGSAAKTFSFGFFTIPANGDYTRVQVPLHAMTNAAEAPATSVALDTTLWGWTISGEWQDGAVVRLDDVSIRY